MRFRDWVAVFVEGFEVEDNSVADQFFHFDLCICGGDATGQIRDVGGVAVVGSFDADGVLHSDSPLRLQPVGWVSRRRNPTVPVELSNQCNPKESKDF